MIIDLDELRHLYVDQLLSSRQIAARLGVDQGTVLVRLRRMGVLRGVHQKLSEEAKEKIRQSHLGKKHSPETRKRIGEAHKGLRGDKHSQWKGGRVADGSGYILIWVPNDSPYASMMKRTCYVPEHRLVMAQHLGRPLTHFEQVHHKNGLKDDNRIENLQLVSITGHGTQYSAGYKQGFKDGAELRDKELEKQIKLLRWQIENLQKQLQGRLV